MKWRRKVLVFTIILGSGVLSFGPLLNHSISRRLSADWNAETKVASARLSLGSSSLSMAGLQIEHPEFTLSGKQFLLKLNSDQLWFRDCQIDSMVGQGIVWKMNRDTAAPWHNPTTTAKSIQEASRALVLFEDICAQHEKDAQNLLNSAQELVNDAERNRTARGRQIVSRLTDLELSIDGLRGPEQLANPLRASKRIDQIRTAANDIKWMLAEERDEVKMLNRKLSDSFGQISNFADRVGTTAPAPSFDLDALTTQIATALMEYVEQRLSPYEHASELASHFLVMQKDNENTDSKSVTKLHQADLGTDALVPGFRPRMSRIVKGKVTGQSVIEGTAEDVEISIATSARNAEQIDGRLSVAWHAAADAAGRAVATQSVVSTQSQKNKLVGKTLHLQRTESSVRMDMQSALNLDLEDRTAGVTLNAIDKVDLLQPLALSTESMPPDLVQAWLHGTSSKVASPSSKTEVNTAAPEQRNWKFNADELQQFRNWLAEEFKGRTSTRVEKLNASIKSQIQADGARLTSRTESLESSVKDSQKEWNAKIDSLLARAIDWESQQLRASTPAGNTIR